MDRSRAALAYLMEFHVFDTEPLRLRTYCISGTWQSDGRGRGGFGERDYRRRAEKGLWSQGGAAASAGGQGNR
jgi:hypothetical protein